MKRALSDSQILRELLADLESMQRSKQSKSRSFVIYFSMGLAQPMFGSFLGFFRPLTIYLFGSFGGVGNNGQLAFGNPGNSTGKKQFLFGAVDCRDASDFRGECEDGIRMSRKNPHQTIGNSEHDLGGFTLPGDLFRIDDGCGKGGKVHLDFSSLLFSTASSMVPT